MDDETVYCRLCERFHEPEEICENDRAALYGDLLRAISTLSDPVPEPPESDRVLRYAVAGQRLAQLLHFDTIDQLVRDVGQDVR
jgi:hypothetical protein